MNYDTMDAGREMDALVAEKVMGLRVEGSISLELRYTPQPEYYASPLLGYSTSISAAWEVVEKMWGECFRLMRFSHGEGKVALEGPWWRAEFGLMKEFVEAPTAPLAICRAALKSTAKEER